MCHNYFVPLSTLTWRNKKGRRFNFWDASGTDGLCFVSLWRVEWKTDLGYELMLLGRSPAENVVAAPAENVLASDFASVLFIFDGIFHGGARGTRLGCVILILVFTFMFLIP